jgi:hypothetical protein
MDTATSGHGPLHVLVANVTMRARTGTEVVVRQLALGGFAPAARSSSRTETGSRAS